MLKQQKKKPSRACAIEDLKIIPPESPFKIQLKIENEKRTPLPNGRRSRVTDKTMTGSYVYSKAAKEISTKIALDATLRFAASNNRKRHIKDRAIDVQRKDIQEKVYLNKTRASIIFVVDASGSMRSNQRIKEAKAALLGLLTEAYTNRDRVGLIIFRNNGARLLLPPTNSVTLAKRLLNKIPCGGKTPLDAGLSLALRTLLIEKARDKDTLQLMVILSDGKANQSSKGDPVLEALRTAAQINRLSIPTIFIDTDEDWHEPGIGRKLARYMNGMYCSLGQIKADKIIKIVRGFQYR